MTNPIDRTGLRIGRLTIERLDKVQNGNRYWFCKCDCGKTKSIQWEHLRRGSANSCGCLRVELAKARMTTHGYGSRRARPAEYASWNNMKQRCLNPNVKEFRLYGARGISVCNEWLKFENFLRDMGRCPEGMQIERKDNNGNYEPSNCKWADTIEQGNNRRNNRVIEFNGKSQTLSQWSREVGISVKTLWRRISVSKWSIELAMTKAVRYQQQRCQKQYPNTA